MRNLRTTVNICLRRIGCHLQRQAYDHVLREEDLEREAIEALMEYIARNPERRGLIGQDEYASYGFTGCLLLGYPLLQLFRADSWGRLWRTLSYLKRTECHSVPDPVAGQP